MPLDMTQFHPVFFEETAEHLSTMELLLLHLDPENPDPAQLEDIGRAAHSIKGSGGTFGFRDMANLAAEAETLIDGVRKGDRRLTADMVGALRAACGALKSLLAGHRGESAATDDVAASVTALLRGFSGERPAASARNGEVSLPETAPDPAALAGELRELAQRTAAASGEVMALVEAAGAGGLHEVTGAVRELGEAIERHAALAEQAADNAESLRESFRALVKAIAGLALSQPARRPLSARPRPLPKFRRTTDTSGSDREWPEF
jgi:two-component system chemotaxis sensor kinase CheA